MCILRLKGQFFDYSLINVHAPTEEKEDEIKDQFYSELKTAYQSCPKNDIKIMHGDFNAKEGKRTAIPIDKVKIQPT